MSIVLVMFNTTQTKTAFVGRIVIFKEFETVSLKSDSEVAFNDFSDIEELSLRQNPFETEVRKQIADGQTVPSDQTTCHDSVLQKQKQQIFFQMTAILWPKRMFREGKTLKVQVLPIIQKLVFNQ